MEILPLLYRREYSSKIVSAFLSFFDALFKTCSASIIEKYNFDDILKKSFYNIKF